MFTVILGLLINGILDVPFIIMCDKIGLNASHGAVLADLVGYSTSIFIALYILGKKYKFNYNDTLKVLPKYVFSILLFCSFPSHAYYYYYYSVFVFFFNVSRKLSMITKINKLVINL